MKSKPVENIVKEYINIEKNFLFYKKHKKFFSLVSQIKKNGKEIDWLKLCYHADMIDKDLMKILVTKLSESKIDLDDLREKVQNIQILIDKQLKDDLEDLVNKNYMNQAAISSNDEGYYFNRETFRNNLIEMASIVRNGEQLYIYNQVKGIYDVLTGLLLGQITKYLMDRALLNFWQGSYEKEIILGLERSVNTFEDADIEMKICLKNGVYDLKEKNLLPHTSNNFFTSQIPISYNESAKCPRFLQFINEITCNDNTIADNLQEIIGYTLINNTKAEKGFIFYGNGSNGKTVIAEILTAMLGKNNISNISLQKFGQRFGIADIENKIANIADENELSTKLNTEALKGIISGDTIQIERKGKDAKSYKPTCKLIFLVNTLPNSTDNSYGYYRKIRIIPFNKTFTPQEQDKDLRDKLLKEIQGILLWALEGAIRLLNNNYNFTLSKAIDEVNKNYEFMQNPVPTFFEEVLIYEEGARTSRTDILNSYKLWLKNNSLDGNGTESNQKFWMMLEDEAKRNKVKLDFVKIKGHGHLRNFKICQENLQEKRENMLLKFTD